MSDGYELNIVIDTDDEPSEALVDLMKGIVDLINKQAPQLEARLEVWEPAGVDLPDVGIPITDPLGRDMVAIPMNDAARRLT